MKVGRRLATKLLNVTQVRARHPATTGRRATPSATRSTRRCCARLDAVDRRGDDGVRRVRLRPRARAHRGVLLVVLRRLRRAGQGPGLRRPRATRPRRRRRPRCASPSTRCSGCSPRSCRSPPRRRGAGGTTRASTPRRGRRPRGVPTRRRRPRRRQRGARHGAPGQDRGQGRASGRAVATLHLTGPSRCIAALDAGPADLVETLTVRRAGARSTAPSSAADDRTLGHRRMRARSAATVTPSRTVRRLMTATGHHAPRHGRTWPERLAIIGTTDRRRRARLLPRRRQRSSPARTSSSQRPRAPFAIANPADSRATASRDDHRRRRRARSTDGRRRRRRPDDAPPAAADRRRRETFPPADPRPRTSSSPAPTTARASTPTRPTRGRSATESGRVGERSDTIMVLRVDPAAERVAVLSFPATCT